MKGSYQWKKKFPGNSCTIFRRDQICGDLYGKIFSSTCIASLNGKKYSFLTKGFFKKETQIIDNDLEQVVGTIVYGGWNNKATIRYNNGEYLWIYTNYINTKWSIKQNNRELASFKSTLGNGYIESYVEDPVLILAGIFIHNYFSQAMVAVFIAVFIPILITNR